MHCSMVTSWRVPKALSKQQNVNLLRCNRTQASLSPHAALCQGSGSLSQLRNLSAMQDCSCNHSRWRCCTYRFCSGLLQSGCLPQWLYLWASGYGSHVQRQVFPPALLPGIVLRLIHPAPLLSAAYHLAAALSAACAPMQLKRLLAGP